jgi:hypothetical protein
MTTTTTSSGVTFTDSGETVPILPERIPARAFIARRNGLYNTTFYSTADGWWFEACACVRTPCARCADGQAVRVGTSRTAAVRAFSRRTASPYDRDAFARADRTLAIWEEAHHAIAYGLAAVRVADGPRTGILHRLALLAGRGPLSPAQTAWAGRLLEERS